MKVSTIAAKDFALAPDCRTTIDVKKGDDITVDSSSVIGMIAAGQIKEPKNFAKMLEGSMTTKNVPDEQESVPETAVDLTTMDKDALETYAMDEFGVELDKRRSRKGLIAEIIALASDA